MTPDLSPEAWAQIRYDYEHTDRPVEDICIEYGISSGTLRDRMRRWGWRRRRPPISAEGPPPAPPVEPTSRTEVIEPQRDPYVIPHPNPPPQAGEERMGDRPLQNAVVQHQVAQAGEGRIGDHPPTGGGKSLVPPQAGEGGMGDYPPDSTGRDTAFPDGAVRHHAHQEPFRGRDMASREYAAGGTDTEGNDGSAPAESNPATIVPLLQGAVARVLPAIEAIITRLAAGATHPREMEQAGRALSSLTRTLRELNTLLSEQQARAPAGRICDCDDDLPEDLDEFRHALARRIEAFVESRRGETPGEPQAS